MSKAQKYRSLEFLPESIIVYKKGSHLINLYEVLEECPSHFPACFGSVTGDHLTYYIFHLASLLHHFLLKYKFQEGMGLTFFFNLSAQPIRLSKVGTL